MTICSTCQGVIAQADRRVRRDPDYLEEINGYLAEEGLSYSGNTTVKHLLWVTRRRHRSRDAQKDIRQRTIRRKPRTILWLLHRPTIRRTRFRRKPRTTNIPRNRHRSRRRKRHRLPRKNRLLRIPHPPHQPTQLPTHGRQPHRHRQRTRRRRNGHTMPPLPPKPRRLPTQSTPTKQPRQSRPTNQSTSHNS